MISHLNKCIFVHIPKTGGSSIEDLIFKKNERTTENLWMGFIDKYNNKFQTGGLQHLKAFQIRNIFGKEIYDVYYKFSIVRNPYLKAISQFEYLKKRDDLCDYLGYNKTQSFKKYLELIQKTSHVQWEQQSNFIYDENDILIVDFVGKFENFETEVNKVLNNLSLNKSFFGLINKRIPHNNKGKKKDVGYYLDKESEEIIENIYERDFKLLGYDYGIYQ
jgi:hypothetical protein